MKEVDYCGMLNSIRGQCLESIKELLLEYGKGKNHSINFLKEDPQFNKSNVRLVCVYIDDYTRYLLTGFKIVRDKVIFMGQVQHAATSVTENIQASECIFSTESIVECYYSLVNHIKNNTDE